MRDASQRQFDVVIFWALDRFTRAGALQTLQYLNQLSSYGCGLSILYRTLPGFMRHVQRRRDRDSRDHSEAGTSTVI